MLLTLVGTRVRPEELSSSWNDPRANISFEDYTVARIK
jgi:hypothetical protein